MKMGPAARAKDERDLEIVALRSRGFSSAQIAERLGVAASFVRAMSNSIRSADIAASGEPAEAVAAAYWR